MNKLHKVRGAIRIMDQVWDIYHTENVRIRMAAVRIRDKQIRESEEMYAKRLLLKGKTLGLIMHDRILTRD